MDKGSLRNIIGIIGLRRLCRLLLSDADVSARRVR
jgi:hypothetical protein